MNKNVFFIYLLVGTFAIGAGIGSNVVDTNYLKIIARGKYELIGMVEAFSGASTMIFAIPIGLATDRFGSKKILVVGAVLGIIQNLIYLYVFYFVGSDEDALDSNNGEKAKFCLQLYVAIEVLGGIVGGIICGPLIILFIQSIAVGTTTVSLYYYGMIWITGQILGNFVSMGILRANGNMYTLSTLVVPLFIARIICSFALCPIIFMDDKYCREKDVLEEKTPVLETSDMKKGDEKSSKTLLIPSLFLTNDLLVVLFLGLFESYYPLYMAQIGMSPDTVQLTQSLAMISTIFLKTLVTYMIELGLKRMHAWLTFQTIGITGIGLLVVFRSYLETHTLVFAVIYIVSIGFRSSVSHVRQAMIMDNTPENRIGLVDSLDSITGATYGVTSMVGGNIIDKYGCSATLAISVVGQCFAIFESLVLLPLVPQDKMKLTGDEVDFTEDTENLEKSMLVSKACSAEDTVGGLGFSKKVKSRPSLLRRTSSAICQGIVPTVHGMDDVSANCNHTKRYLRTSIKGRNSFRAL